MPNEQIAGLTIAFEPEAPQEVDTFDFQVPDFYRRLGYTLFGQLGPYGDGHTRYYFQKALPNLQLPDPRHAEAG